MHPSRPLYPARTAHLHARHNAGVAQSNAVAMQQTQGACTGMHNCPGCTTLTMHSAPCWPPLHDPSMWQQHRPPQCHAAQWAAPHANGWPAIWWISQPAATAIYASPPILRDQSHTINNTPLHLLLINPTLSTTGLGAYDAINPTLSTTGPDALLCDHSHARHHACIHMVQYVAVV